MHSRTHQFQKEIYTWHTTGARFFPWRIPALKERADGSVSPHNILVSESILQQTQTSRVVEKYPDFLKKFPTLRKLADAPLADVVRAWQGLGYNRRAKALHQAVKEIVQAYRGRIPRERSQLEALPGIGPYTAGALRVFAFNEGDVLIETNIRTVYFHHFFPERERITDTELYEIVEQTYDRKNPRAWYTALMDYGAYLKSKGVRLNTKSKHYTKQSKFAGSERQIRGALLRLLSKKPQTFRMLCTNLGMEPMRIQQQLKALVDEGMVEQLKKWYQLRA